MAMKSLFRLSLVLSVLLAAACTTVRGMPVAERGSVTVGMTQDEVRRTIGEPDSFDNTEGGLSSWVYRHDKPERPDGLVEADEICFDDQHRVRTVKAILAGVGQ